MMKPSLTPDYAVVANNWRSAAQRARERATACDAVAAVAQKCLEHERTWGCLLDDVPQGYSEVADMLADELRAKAREAFATITKYPENQQEAELVRLTAVLVEVGEVLEGYNAPKAATPAEQIRLLVEALKGQHAIDLGERYR